MFHTQQEGATAVHYATWANDITVLSTLLKHKADVNLAVQEGEQIFKVQLDDAKLFQHEHYAVL